MSATSPVWPKESCSGCEFLGNHLGRDLYVCGGSRGYERVLVQYAAAPSEYACYHVTDGRLSYEYGGTYSDSAREAIRLLAKRSEDSLVT
jgi:hypothetical protein